MHRAWGKAGLRRFCRVGGLQVRFLRKAQPEHVQLAPSQDLQGDAEQAFLFQFDPRPADAGFVHPGLLRDDGNRDRRFGPMPTQCVAGDAKHQAQLGLGEVTHRVEEAMR